MKRPDEEDAILTNDLVSRDEARAPISGGEITLGKILVLDFLKKRGYEIHPAAKIVPRMTSDQFLSLFKDIKEHGIVEPIKRTPDGLIIDGRHRLAAALLSGRALKEKHFETVKLTERAAWKLVGKVNFHRRDMTPSQRAMFAAELKAQGVKTRESTVGNVSGESIGRAERVLKHGDQSLIDAVRSGVISVSAAAEMATGLRPRRDQTQKRTRALSAAPVATKSKSVGRPIGKSLINKLDRALDHVIALEPLVNKLKKQWSNNSDKLEKLERGAKILKNLHRMLQKDDDPEF